MATLVNQINTHKSKLYFFPRNFLQLGNTLVFLLYLVAKHPDVQEKIYDEVSRLAPAGTPITAEHLRHATYLHACISEAHRYKLQYIKQGKRKCRVGRSVLEVFKMFVDAGKR